MDILLFEDNAVFCQNFEAGIDAVASVSEQGVPVKVRTAKGDWWDFIEANVHKGEPIAEPAVRASQGTLRWPKEMAWIIDLHIGTNVSATGIAKLNAYLDVHLQRDSKLRKLWEDLTQFFPNDWPSLKPGIALAVYARQHLGRFRFLSKYAPLSDAPMRMLISYILGSNNPKPIADIDFDKGRFGEPTPSGLITETTREAFTEIIEWAQAGEGRSGIRSPDDKTFLGFTALHWTAFGVIVAILLYAASQI